MDYLNHPLITYLEYWIRKIFPSFFHFLLYPALLVGLILQHWVIPNYARQAFSAPTSFVYSRADNPHTVIPIHTTPLAQGGMTDIEKSVLTITLDNLPLVDVEKVGMIAAIANPDIGSQNGEANGAIYDEAGVIMIGLNAAQGDPFLFQQMLLHEVGHAVEFHVLTSKEDNVWIQLHRASSDPSDYVSTYAQTGDDGLGHAGDDFAETYMTWATQTDGFGSNAVEAVTKGHTLLLQKYLFMAAQFVNPDNTMTFYNVTDVPFGSSGPAVGYNPFSEITEKRPYYRTADSLTIGNYTYLLKGNIITSIVSGPGVIADNLSIPVPQILLDKLKMTGPAPGSAVTNPTMPGIQVPQLNPTIKLPGGGSIRTPLHSFGIQITSPRAPNNYIPLTSDAGYAALAGEQALVHDPTKLPTLEDQIRPHGDFVIQATPH